MTERVLLPFCGAVPKNYLQKYKGIESEIVSLYNSKKQKIPKGERKKVKEKVDFWAHFTKESKNSFESKYMF